MLASQSITNPYALMMQNNQVTRSQLEECLAGSTYESQVYPDKLAHIEYLYLRTQGVSCCLRDGILETIHLYIQGDKVFQPYTNHLPYNIGRGTTNQNIVSFLGEPDEKLGGGLTNISIVYNRLGLEIYFLTKVWDLDKAGIDQIVMFPVKVVDHICATCRTLCEARCNRCKLVYYCTSKCQTTHWKAHKPYCQEYL